MKTCFTFCGFMLFAACGFAGEESVLVNKPEATPVVVTRDCSNCGPTLVCVDGRCGSRLYSVQSESQETCRNRLFGGHVVRKNSRTVYKPVRR